MLHFNYTELVLYLSVLCMVVTQLDNIFKMFIDLRQLFPKKPKRNSTRTKERRKNKHNHKK